MTSNPFRRAPLFVALLVLAQLLAAPAAHAAIRELPDALFRTGHENNACGNDVVEDVEQCDDGDPENGDGCPTNCRFIQCGDAEIEPQFEECDQGPFGGDGDGCTAETCQVEPGFACSGEPSTCFAICGDGVIASIEECDDADMLDGNGCSASCSIENGWQCFGRPSLCQTICGDSMIVGPETCDDGNLMPGDGCSDSCTIECTADTEPNDSPAQALANGARQPLFTVCFGNVTPQTDRDVFAITVPVTVDLELETLASGATMPCGPGVDTSLELIAPGGATTLAMRDDGAANACAKIGAADPGALGLPPGTYYAAVTETGNDATLQYGLRARFSAICQNGIREGSEECDDGNSDEGDECSLCRLRVQPAVTGTDYAVAAHGARVVATGVRFSDATDLTVGGVAQTFTVDSDTQITLTIADSTPLGAQNLVVTDASGSSAPFGLTVIRLVIGELDADQTSTDMLEFVEIATGVPGVSLAGYALTFWNGSTDVSYASINLAASTDSNGRLLVGNSGVVPVPALTFANDFLQNGQDAVSIHQGAPYPNATAVTATDLLDAVVYDTSDPDDPTLLDVLLATVGNPERVQVDENGSATGTTVSIQRCGTARRDGRVYVVAAPTPGATNACPP